MRYPVVNLQPRLGQVKEFETLTDQQLSRIQNATDTYNNWKDWSDTPTGDRYMRDAVSDIQSAIDSVPEAVRLGAMQEIQKYIDNLDQDMLDRLRMPGPGTPRAEPGAAPVASIDRARTEPPPPPPTNPPVASGQPGPGYSPHEPVADIAPKSYPPYQPPEEPEPTGFTGSEPEPPVEVKNPPPPPPIAKPPPPPPPPVASGGNGCYYTFGQGYSWGARPPSGEPTGLNQAACQNLIAMDREIRGLPAQNTAPPSSNVQAQTTQQNTASMAPQTPPPKPPGNAPVATGGPAACGPGQFWDGTRCRGSVAPGFGNLMNAAGGGGGEAAAGISPSNLDINPASIANASFAGIGSRKRRYPVVNL